MIKRHKLHKLRVFIAIYQYFYRSVGVSEKTNWFIRIDLTQASHLLLEENENKCFSVMYQVNCLINQSISYLSNSNCILQVLPITFNKFCIWSASLVLSSMIHFILFIPSVSRFSSQSYQRAVQLKWYVLVLHHGVTLWWRNYSPFDSNMTSLTCILASPSLFKLVHLQFCISESELLPC